MFLLCFLSALEFFVTPSFEKAAPPPPLRGRHELGFIPAWSFQHYLRVKNSCRKKALPRALSLHGWQRFLCCEGQLATSACGLYLPSHCLEEDNLFQRPVHLRHVRVPLCRYCSPLLLSWFCSATVMQSEYCAPTLSSFQYTKKIR